jgi:hypothetical protein
MTLRGIDSIAISDTNGKGNHIKNCTILSTPSLATGIQLTNCTDDTAKLLPIVSAQNRQT